MSQTSQRTDSEFDPLDMYQTLQEQNVNFANSYHRFFSNCKLAMIVAFWITAWGLCSFNLFLKDVTFGGPDCKPWDIGITVIKAGVERTSPHTVTAPPMDPISSITVNSTEAVQHAPNLRGNSTETPSEKPSTVSSSAATDVATVATLERLLEATSEEEIWCGYLPSTYADSWGNVVQMILFTVYLNCGVTIQQAWQGIAGTALAVLNYAVMVQLYPEGGNDWFVWLNVLGYIFCVLLSGAAENTMKFSMNWHCWFMMTFMTSGPSPGEIPVRIFGFKIPHVTWDSYPATSLFTSIIGCTVAVIATILPPPPLSNYRKVYGTADNIVKGYRAIWSKSIAYFCNTSPGAIRCVLAEAIDGLSATTNTALADLKASWWESFDLFGQGRRRRLYMAFYTSMKQMDGVMLAVKDSLEKEDFQGSHNFFCTAMQPRMSALQDAACNLLDLCQKACEDGTIADDERDDLLEGIDEVREQQRETLKLCQEVSNSGQVRQTGLISQDLLNENTFLFGLSVFAGKVVDLAELIANIEDNEAGSPFSSLLTSLAHGARKVFAVPSKDKIAFAVRNWISIAVCFVIGYSVDCEKCVFTKHDANMAAMLTLLINHYSGSAFLNNLKRLLGVVIGKVLPIMILGVVDPMNSQGIFNYFDCSGGSGCVLMVVIVFTYTWFFTYMYYTSANWGTIGCLAAAFGCAVLIRPCGSVSSNYNYNYQEVAQDVFAILLALAMDMLFDAFMGKVPRDAAVENIQALKDGFVNSIDAFFDGDLESMEQSMSMTFDTLTEATTFAYEADPALEMIPGIRADFKISLYNAALKAFRLLHADLSMLLMASKAWEVLDVPHDGNDTSQWVANRCGVQSDMDFSVTSYLAALDTIHSNSGDLRGIKDELMQMLELVLDTVKNLLAHGREDNDFQPAEITAKVVNIGTLGYERESHLYQEIGARPIKSPAAESIIFDPRARMTVVVKALVNAREHLVAIEEALSKHLSL